MKPVVNKGNVRPRIWRCDSRLPLVATSRSPSAASCRTRPGKGPGERGPGSVPLGDAARRYERDFVLLPGFMIHHRLLPALCLATALTLTAAIAQTPAADAHEALRSLLADEWERGLRDFPESATSNGDHRFDDRWTDLSLAAIAARGGRPRSARTRAPHRPCAAE